MFQLLHIPKFEVILLFFTVTVTYCVYTSPKTVSVSLEILQQVPKELLPELYRKYLDAANDDSQYSTLRRMFSRGKEYEIHVQKLKEVNGFKRHNLLIKGINKMKGNPVIYINNPVESKIPNAFLTLKEFKRALLARAIKDQNRASKFKFTKSIDRIESKVAVEDLPTRTSLHISKTNDDSVNELKSTSSKVNTVTVMTIGFNKIMSSTHFAEQVENQNLEPKPISSDVTLPNELKETRTTFIFTDIFTKTKSIETSTSTSDLHLTEEPVLKSVNLQSAGEDVVISSTAENNIATETTTSCTTTKKYKRKPTEATTKSRRSTLGRPMVFMGSK